MKKRIISLILVFVCALSLFPSMQVLAEEPEIEVEKLEETDKAAESVEDLDSIEVDGKDITVALLDTGVNKTDINDGRIVGESSDDNGHGTIMADIICANTDKKVKILPIDVFDEEGKCSVSNLVDGIEKAIEEKADVINISASSEGKSKELEEVIRKAREKGIYVVVSAGNEASDVTQYMPSNIEEAIVVSGLELNGDFAIYSNYGRMIDYSAIGTVKRGERTFSGTSVAAANVSSYVAMILEAEKDVEQTLLDAKVGEGFDNYYGNGVLSKEGVESALKINNNQEEQEESTENDQLINESTSPLNPVVEPNVINNTEINVAGGWFYDYWMVGNWGDFVDGVWNQGATKFVLVSDVSISDLWVIDGGSHYTISGNGHQLVNTRPDLGPMFLVRNGGVLTTENNLVLNGNNHRNNGAGNEGGSSCVDCINATFFANQTTFCNNWNYGYLPGIDNLGGGTGFNIVAENGTNSAYGKAVGCVAYNCDGAGFFVRNDDGRGATMECEGCVAYDCSWSFMASSGVMNLNGCISNASRHDSSKDKFGGPYGGCGICYTGGSGTASDCTSQGAFAAFWVNSNGTLNNCTGINSPYGYFGIGGTANDSKFYDNQYGVCNWGGTINLNRCKVYDNSTGVCSYGVTNVDNCSVYNNVVGMSIEEFIIPTSYIINMNGGECKNNTWMDIYQNGTLCLSGNATNTSSTGIYLCNGRHISVVGNLSRTSNVTLAPESNTLGRKVVEAVFVECSSILSKFKLNAIKTTSGRDGILRCGVGTNGATNTIILSEKYTVTYKANLNKAGVSEIVPGVEYFYWKEEGTLKTGQRPVLNKNGKTYTGYSFVNWNTNRFGVGTSYTKNTKITLSNDLVLYAIYVDDINPTAGITVTPTSWDDVNGLVTIRAIDEGSGLARIDLYRRNLVIGKEELVRIYSFSGDNDERICRFTQVEEGEYIFTARVYDKDGNVTVLTSQRMKIDKSGPQIHGLEDTNTDWTNKAPVIRVSATDYLSNTSYTGSGVKKVNIIDDKGVVVASGINYASFTLTEIYEGRHTFTIKVWDNLDHETTDSVTTKYDITAPVMTGTETSSVEDSIYVGDNIIDQNINDHFSNSRYANDSSGIKSVVLYEYRDGKLEEVKNENTRTFFSKDDTNNTFHEKYVIKEKDKNVEYYLLEVYDFAGNKTTKKITSQRYLLTLMRTSIDKSTYVV